MLGIPVAELNRVMTASEYSGWHIHREQYPETEVLLSQLLVMLAKQFAKKGVEIDVQKLTGFWLETPEARAKREEKEHNAMVLNRAFNYLQAYKRLRANG